MQDLDPSDICKKKILNPLKRIRVIIRTPTHGRTDGRTDRQTDGRTNRVNPVYPPNFVIISRLAFEGLVYEFRSPVDQARACSFIRSKNFCMLGFTL